MHRRLPEVALGALLATATFAICQVLFASGHFEWWTKDPSGFFASLQVVVGVLQAYLFWLQFGYMSEGIAVAKDTARTAADTASATRLQIKLAHRPFVAPMNGMHVAGPLTIGSGTLSLPITISWKNVGTFPARGFNVFPKIIVGPIPRNASEIAQHISHDFTFETKEFRQSLMAGDLIMPSAAMEDYPINFTTNSDGTSDQPFSVWVLVAIAYWGQERDNEGIPIPYLGTFAYQFLADEASSPKSTSIAGKLLPIYGISAGTT